MDRPCAFIFASSVVIFGALGSKGVGKSAVLNRLFDTDFAVEKPGARAPAGTTPAIDRPHFPFTGSHIKASACVEQGLACRLGRGGRSSAWTVRAATRAVRRRP